MRAVNPVDFSADERFAPVRQRQPDRRERRACAKAHLGFGWNETAGADLPDNRKRALLDHLDHKKQRRVQPLVFKENAEVVFGDHAGQDVVRQFERVFVRQPLPVALFRVHRVDERLHAAW